MRSFRLTLLAALLVVFVVAPARAAVGIESGDGQHAVIGNALPEAFIARVTDRHGAPLSGVPVTFTVTAGGAQPERQTVDSGADGLARFQPLVTRYGALRVRVRAQGDSGQASFNAVVTGWVSTLAGDGIRAYGGDGGPATHAQMNAPFGMALAGGELLVVDYFNHALRAVDLETGGIRPVAGNGRQGFNGDGHAPLDSLLSGPFGIALGSRGEIYISDYYNNRIRAFTGESGTLKTIAGDGVVGYRGDGGPGPEARIDVPLDIAADSKGNVYLSDWHHHVVRRVDAVTGVIDTIAGIGRAAYTGEGPARRGALATPLGLSVDEHDNLYIADYGNNRVRRIDARSGEISTVAGSGVRGFAGDDGPALSARLNRPYNVYADRRGGLFISDAGNHRVRHVDLASGIITTVMGNGQMASAGAPTLATRAPFAGPFAVTGDDQGNLYVAEYFGHKIQQVGPALPALPQPEARGSRLLRQARQVFGELPEEAVTGAYAVTDAKVALGRSLFHDTGLSADGSVSCATCHPLERYGMDSLPLAVGIGEQVGIRNTPSVFNAALQDSQFWDGRSATVESQVRDPLLHPKEMAMPDEAAVLAAVSSQPRYRALFAAAFPGEDAPLGFDNLSTALGAFQRRLLTPNAPFDRYLAGQASALDAQALDGLEVFLREGCASCHAGPLLGGQDMHLMADYPNTRAGDRFEFRKRLGNTHKVKIAPLRNIAKTAPYLHDGRYATLADSLGRRLDAYLVREASLRDEVELGPGELEALVAFMESLTGQIDPDYIALGE